MSSHIGSKVTKNRPPRAPERTIRILEVLTQHREGLSLSAISNATQLPITSLAAMLKALVVSGYLQRHERLYRLGPASFRLGAAMGPPSRLLQLVRPWLERLSEQTRETVLLGILAEDEPVLVYIDRIEAKHPIRFGMSIGARRPLYCTALGKVLLAFQPDDWRERYLSDTRFEPFTRRTIKNKADLRRMVTAVRRDGLASTRDESALGVSGWASPLLGHAGRAVAALGIAMPSNRARVHGKQFGTWVRVAAREVSESLGYR